MNEKQDFEEYIRTLKKRSRIEGIVMLIAGLIALVIVLPHFLDFGGGFPFAAVFGSLVPAACIIMSIYFMAAFRRRLGRMQKMLGTDEEGFARLYEESMPLAAGHEYYFINDDCLLNFVSFKAYPVTAVKSLKKSMTHADENSSARYHINIKLDKSSIGKAGDTLSFSYSYERDKAYDLISEKFFSLTGGYPDGWEKYNK